MIILILHFLSISTSAASDPILREGNADHADIDSAKLPAGTPKLFDGEVKGESFDLFVRNLPAQSVTIELGFVDTESTGPQQHAFAVAANGVPLDANLDVWSKAGGAFKPWVMKKTINHAGGSLSIMFSGLGHPAFVSYARLTDAAGKELASGAFNDWRSAERLTLLDSRARPFKRTRVGDVAFFDVDHSPNGSWSTFVYGMEQSGGVQVCTQAGGDSTLLPHDGVIIAAKRGRVERIMPFASGQTSVPKESWISEKEVTRKLGASTDAWTIPMGVSWTHYSPVWSMRDWGTASATEKRRFVLPVTWMQYHLDNRSGKEELRLLFSLQQPARRAQGWSGFDGYVIGDNSSVAVKAGEAELLTETQAKAAFGVEHATSAFCAHVPAGAQKVITFYVVQYRAGVISHLADNSLTLICAALYSDINDILKTAEETLPEAIGRCREVDAKLAGCGQDEERRFLAADALHSYQFNSIFFATSKDKRPIWAVMEGECAYINTLDLTVDHVFFELAMHPWTVRNELDTFAKYYSYTDRLCLRGQSQNLPGGLGFCHDMGNGLTFSDPGKGAAYGTPMTQEELQNWIICGALYWKSTGDNAWLEKNRDLFNRALQSMQLRDDVDPARRDGITTYINTSGEITTYDAMDASLVHPDNSLYIAVKSFACYNMLAPVFRQLNEPALAAEAQKAVAYTVKGIDSHWDESKHLFPATFDGNSRSMIIPAIEGLAYPYAMGLRKEVALDGPNAGLISRLKTYLNTILVPGACVDRETGGLNLSSSSSTTWQSKVYLNQFVAENVLGIRNSIIGQTADAAQYAYQVLGCPAVCFSDQIYTDSHIAFGCRHYPRGVTSALWWLWPSKWRPSDP